MSIRKNNIADLWQDLRFSARMLKTKPGFTMAAALALALGIAAVPALLAFVALLACFIPARRATKVNPMISLRCE